MEQLLHFCSNHLFVLNTAQLSRYTGRTDGRTDRTGDRTDRTDGRTDNRTARTSTRSAQIGQYGRQSRGFLLVRYPVRLPVR